MMRQFRASFTKDIRILFRSWTSIFLVLIGPLLLMLILMLAFSNLGFNNINIGYTGIEGTKYSDFMPKIDYLGNFIEYSSLELCQQDLKLQKVHLCLEPKDDVLKVHFDNTRELISLVLLNQIRVSATYEKDSLLEKNAQGILSDVKDVGSLLQEGERFSNLLLNDLQNQKDDLKETSDDLNEAQQEVRKRIDQLEDLRNTINVAKIEVVTVVDAEVDKTIQSLDEVENYFYLAYLQSFNAGEYGVANDFLASKNEIFQSKNKINVARNGFNQGLRDVDELLRVIDLSISELRDAEIFLDENKNKIDNTIKTIDSRSRDLNDLKGDIHLQRNKLNKVNAMGVSELVNPMDLGYVPMFLASERLQRINLNLDLNPEEKQRLVNFGTIQTFIPLVIILLISFIATILSNIILLDEIHSPAFLRNRIAPVSWIVGFISKFTTVLSVTIVQSAIILIIGYFVFFLDIARSIHTIFLVLMLLIGIYSVVGMIIAYIVKTKTTSLLVCSFFLIINLLLGGVVYPIERMAPFMSHFAKLIPFSPGISMLQQSVFYNVSLLSLWPQLLKLVLIFVICLLVMLGARKIFLYRYAKGQ
ncbi:MAG: ABC transporter permease [Candidatus Woesearchaeota archaeon]